MFKPDKRGRFYFTSSLPIELSQAQPDDNNFFVSNNQDLEMKTCYLPATV